VTGHDGSLGRIGLVRGSGFPCRNWLIRGAHDLNRIELSVGVEIESDARGDRLQSFSVDVADNRHDRAGLIGGLRRITAHRQELVHRAFRRSRWQLRFQHVLNGLELRIIDLQCLLATNEKKQTGHGQEEAHPRRETEVANAVEERSHGMGPLFNNLEAIFLNDRIGEDFFRDALQLFLGFVTVPAVEV